TIMLVEGFNLEGEAFQLEPGSAARISCGAASGPSMAAKPCSGANEASSKIRATLLLCPTGELAHCAAVARSEAVFETPGELVVDGVPAGEYGLLVEPPVGHPVSLVA